MEKETFWYPVIYLQGWVETWEKPDAFTLHFLPDDFDNDEQQRAMLQRQTENNEGIPLNWVVDRHISWSKKRIKRRKLIGF